MKVFERRKKGYEREPKIKVYGSIRKYKKEFESIYENI